MLKRVPITTSSATRKLRWLVCGLATLMAMAINGCARQIPCAVIEAMPADPPRPPNACVVDGCSMAPDFDFARCCNQHDARYWRGGSANARALADQEFGQCVSGKNHRILAKLYYLGVRIGGTPYLPTPWRWGFGWRYPHGYGADPPSADD